MHNVIKKGKKKVERRMKPFLIFRRAEVVRITDYYFNEWGDLEAKHKNKFFTHITNFEKFQKPIYEAAIMSFKHDHCHLKFGIADSTWTGGWSEGLDYDPLYMSDMCALYVFKTPSVDLYAFWKHFDKVKSIACSN